MSEFPMLSGNFIVLSKHYFLLYQFDR